MTAIDPHLDHLADRIRPRVASGVLLWAIFAFLVLFLLWAGLTRIDRTVHAAGRVIPSARLQVVTNHEGGIVDAILVAAGQPVRRGDVLIRLSPIASSADVNASRGNVVALTARVARLRAEVAGRSPVYPQDDEARLPVLAEQAIHSARMSDLASQTAAATARIIQADRAVAEAEASYRSHRAARDAAREQLDLVRPLVDGGIEPRVTLIQLQNDVNRGEADTAQAAAAIARARAAVAEARAALAQARENWRVQATTDLATTQADLGARESAAPALADRLRRAVVIAPVDGQVNRVLATTVGSSIAAGQPIVEIVPSRDALTIEASVSPRDIGAVRLGQHVKINISAYDSAIYGSLAGRVTTISPDAVIDERTGESHYTIRIRAVGEPLHDQTGRKLPIGAGMIADASLLGDKRSILSYLLTPITRLRENALRE